MSNEQTANFQQCAHLETDDSYRKLRESGGDALGLIFEMQESIQRDVYEHDFDAIRATVGSVKSFIDWNEEAIRDEDREFQAALTGIHTYPGHWKPWKTKHAEAMSRPFSDLTDDELKELQMEWIDKLHFMVNIAIAIGLTPEKITDFYVAKNRENSRRQQQIGGY